MHRSPDGLSHSPSVTRKYTDHISSTTSPRRAPDTRDLALEHHVRWYPAVLVVLLGGYLFFDRAFAHAHVPGTPIFLAEPVLAIGVVLAANSIEGRRLIRFSTPIRALIGFMLWGLVLLIVHVFDHGVDAVQDSALWYYGLFAIVVGTLVLTWRESIERLIPAYGALLAGFVVVGWVRLAMNGNDEAAAIPDTLVPWTSHRPGNIAIHAAIGFAFVVLLLGPWLAERFEKPLAVALTVVLAVALLILYVGAGTQNRGGFVTGFLVIIGVTLVRRSFGPAVAMISLVVMVVLGLLYATDARVEMGDRDLSVRQLVDNVVSVQNLEDGGRANIWSPVLDDIMTQERFLTGIGFGENLGDRYGFTFRGVKRDGIIVGTTAEDEEVNPLRNVHNSHLNVLARMGFIGAGLWLAVWGLWYFHLFKARSRLRMIDSPMRAAYLGWAMLAMTAILLNAFFDGTLEGPQVGVWAWSIFGLGAAIAMETNMREWQRRRTGAAEISREGGGSNPLDMSLRQLKRATKARRR